MGMAEGSSIGMGESGMWNVCNFKAVRGVKEMKVAKYRYSKKGRGQHCNGRGH